MRPHIVTLGYSKLRRVRRFYENGMGLKASSASQGEIVFYETGAAVLALYPRKSLARDAGLKAKGSGFSGISLAYNLKKKEDVKLAVARALKMGGRQIKAPQDAFWGGHSAYIADPDGHLWEFAWNPFFKFDRKGNLKLPI